MPVNESSTDPAVPALAGANTAGGDGVVGRGRRGVVGESPDFQGVYGHSVQNAGVVGEADKFHAVFGISHDLNSAGVFGTNDGPQGGVGVSGEGSRGGGEGVHGVSHSVNAGVGGG